MNTLPHQQQSHNSPGAAAWMCSVRPCFSLRSHLSPSLYPVSLEVHSVPLELSDSQGWVLSFELSLCSRASLQVWDRHFPTKASQCETCSLLGGEKKHLHSIQQHHFRNWNLFSSLSSFQTQTEQNLCSGTFSALLRPWSIHLRRFKHLIHTMVPTWRSVRLFKCQPCKPSMCCAEWNYHCPNGTLNGSAEGCRKCVILW